MNKINALAAALLLFASCKKNDGATGNTGIGIAIPVIASDTGIFDISYVYRAPAIPDVSGLLLVYNQTTMFTDSMGTTVIHNRQWEAARFIGDTSYHNPAFISINGHNLRNDGSTAHSYLLPDPGNIWNATGSNQWVSAGGNTVPVLSESVSSVIPSFTGTLPPVVPLHSNISYTFNSTNTANADSAYIVLYTPNPGSIVISDAVAANGGTAQISTSFIDSVNWHNKVFNIWGTPCYGALLMAVVYNHEVHTIAGGKKVACVQVKQVVRTVIFQ